MDCWICNWTSLLTKQATFYEVLWNKIIEIDCWVISQERWNTISCVSVQMYFNSYTTLYLCEMIKQLPPLYLAYTEYLM